MRLFIAISLPVRIQHYLLTLQKLFVPHGTYTFTKETHLTLKFLGDTTPAQYNTLIQVLQHITITPFTLTLDKLGVFPHLTTPRVLWTGITPQQPVSRLQHQIDTLLQSHFPPDTRFHPHLTIARIKTITNKQTFAKLLATTLTPLSFTVNNFSLIESTLHSEGPVYTTKKTFGT